MCLAIPGKLIRINGDKGLADFGGVRKEVGLTFVMDEIKKGDWILVHTGFAMEIISDEEAQLTIQALDEAYHVEPISES
ncbi:MAG: HypC/HybG/HupF family hydrogenase formation chaperone [Candidatus Cloacimonetes bacterium]|nr:HypC/HybG/HupF family hydrogenase formation chaperone [Candidatus Cloacimonadota bacterium]